MTKSYLEMPETVDKNDKYRHRVPALSLARNDNIVVATGNFSSAPTDKLRRLFSIGMQMHYKLDRGVPYPDHSSQFVNILVTTEDIPHYRSDPVKSLRASAFAGWLFIPGVSLEQIEKIGRSLLHRLEKMKLL